MVLRARRCDPDDVPTRYLLVDDNGPFLEASRRLLTGEGLNVVGTAGTAAECLRLADELQPDVILVDVDLGADSGLALAARLAEGPASRPVIFMSARPAEDYAELIARTDALGFVAKRELSRGAIEAILENSGPSAGRASATSGT